MDDDYDEDAFLYGDSEPRAAAASKKLSAPSEVEAGRYNSDSHEDEEGNFVNPAAEVEDQAEVKMDTADNDEQRELEDGEEEDEEEEEEEDEDASDDLDIVLDPTGGRSMDFRLPQPIKQAVVGHGLGSVKPATPQKAVPLQNAPGMFPSSNPALTSDYNVAPRPSPSQQLAPPSTTIPQPLAPTLLPQSQPQIIQQPPSSQEQQQQQQGGTPAPVQLDAQQMAVMQQYQQQAMHGINPYSHLPIPHASAINDTPVDLNRVAVLPTGQSIYEIDAEAIQSKAWRAPGADISDWFNYGFDEVSWMAYVRRRREMMAIQAEMDEVRRQIEMAQQQGYAGIDQNQFNMMMNGGWGMDGGMMGMMNNGMPNGPRGMGGMGLQQQQMQQQQQLQYLQSMQQQQMLNGPNEASNNNGNSNITEEGQITNEENGDEQKPAGPSNLPRPPAAAGRGGPLPAGPRGYNAGRGGAGRGGRGGFNGPVPTGPAASIPTGPSSSLPTGPAALNVPTGPRKVAAPPTGPRGSRGHSHKDKDQDRNRDADVGSLDYGGTGGGSGGGGGDEYGANSPTKSNRETSPPKGPSKRISRPASQREESDDRASRKSRSADGEMGNEGVSSSGFSIKGAATDNGGDDEYGRTSRKRAPSDDGHSSSSRSKKR